MACALYEERGYFIVKNIFWKKLFDEMVHFGIVGVINTVAGFILIMLFYNAFHWNYWIASGTSYIVGSIFSYFANKRFTFKAEGGDSNYAVRFAVNIAVCYFLAYGIAKPLVRYVLNGYPQVVVENIAIVIGMGMFIVFNFIGQKFLVFKQKDDRK